MGVKYLLYNNIIRYLFYFCKFSCGGNKMCDSSERENISSLTCSSMVGCRTGRLWNDRFVYYPCTM